VLAGDLAFGGRDSVDEHDRDPPVVELEEAIVGVDVGQQGLDSKLAEEAQCVIAEVTALARDEYDGNHGADPSER
jgi:hypothetical protein